MGPARVRQQAGPSARLFSDRRPNAKDHNQIAAKVMANDAAVTFGRPGEFFEINLIQPLIADNLLKSIGLLERAAAALALKCIKGITANREECHANIEQSWAMSTALAPIMGYE